MQSFTTSIHPLLRQRNEKWGGLLLRTLLPVYLVRSPRTWIIFFSFTILVVSQASGDYVFGACDLPEYSPAPPALMYAPVAVLLDYHTGTILFDRNGSVPRVPASLTKLVTIYTALDAAEQGMFELNQPSPVDPGSYASATAPGSSLMFLGPGQRVNGWDLLRGLAIPSGNDASREVAVRVSQSVGAFAQRMNQVVHSHGLTGMFFEEPAGLSPGNRITAQEMARFSALLLQRWPETVQDLFTLQSFAYPQEHHFPNGVLQGDSVSQANRNLLIGTFPGAEGLKTGYTSAAGYNLAAAARQQDRRLIAVVLGIDGDNHQQGGQRRTADTAELLEWGFREYATLSFDSPSIEEVAVMGGTVRQTTLGVAGEKDLVLPQVMVPALQGQIDIPTTLWAPLRAGEVVGSLRYFVDDCTVHTVPLIIQEDIPPGSIFRRLWDRLRVLIASIFR